MAMHLVAYSISTPVTHSLTHSLSGKKHAPQFSHNQILPPLSETKLHAYQKHQKKLRVLGFHLEVVSIRQKDGRI
jgi:hypothetical protein